jgi:hypothetical protein
MNRGVQIAIAVMLVVIVAAVLISPAVDLEPTALRAVLWVAALFAAFAVVKVVFIAVRMQRLGKWNRRERTAILCAFSPPILDLYGAMLC